MSFIFCLIVPQTAPQHTDIVFLTLRLLGLLKQLALILALSLKRGCEAHKPRFDECVVDSLQFGASFSQSAAKLVIRSRSQFA
jgi:hypothetical protein